MPFPPVIRDAMLNSIIGVPSAIQITYASLHSAVPDATGSNEIAGGSPAYARKLIQFQPAVAGRLLKNPTPPVQFNVPAGATVAFVGLWSAIAGGSFCGYGPLSSDPAMPAIATASSDKFLCPGHGFALNDRILVQPAAGLSTPPGLPPGIYYADPVNSTEFKLRASIGGAYVDVAADGHLIVQRIRIDVFSAQGTVTVSTFTLGLDG